MTIDEIKYKIKQLSKELKEEERKLEEQKDRIIGKYYRCGECIGKVLYKSKSDDEYVCNELYFVDHGCGSEFEQDFCATRSSTELELITYEEFTVLFNDYIEKLRYIFRQDDKKIGEGSLVADSTCQ